MIIREPARKFLNQVASKALGFVARRFGTGPFWVNKPQHSMDWAGISGSPIAFTRWCTTVPLFILTALLIDECGDVLRARASFLYFSLTMQMPHELIHCGYGHRHNTMVVPMPLQVLPERVHNRRWARSWRPIPLRESQNCVDSAPHHAIPVRRLRNLSWVAPSGER